MENKKNIWIGGGVVVLVVAIILIATLTGKKNLPTTPDPLTVPTTQTQPSKARTSTGTPAKSSFSVNSPVTGSTLKRGSTQTVAWTGTAECYDLGYTLNPQGDASYNFIAKVCRNSGGSFSYKWLVPLNIQPATYGLELKSSGSTEAGANGPSFIIK